MRNDVIDGVRGRHLVITSTVDHTERIVCEESKSSLAPSSVVVRLCALTGGLLLTIRADNDHGVRRRRCGRRCRLM